MAKRASEHSESIRVGVSACLLGEHVRYDAGHKHDRYVTDVLGKHFDFVPVCPEVELGLGVPRPTLRLVRSGDEVRMVERSSGIDRTREMNRFARRRASELSRESLCGYIFKRGSPSCGVARVRTYSEKGLPGAGTSGLFAKAVAERMPLLPIEEEGRLNDPRLREAFIERVFAFARVKRLFSGRWTVGQLVAFQAAEKLFLMAHAPAAQRELGRIVAKAKETPRAELAESYSSGFMQAVSKPVSRGRHLNTLQHMFGYFRAILSDRERKELDRVLHDFQSGVVPLIVPVSLIRYLATIHQLEYLIGQTYLEPHPKELMLRNHV